VRALEVAVAQLGVAGDGPLDAVEQVLVVEGLLDEVEGARLHRAHRHLHVAMAGDEDDRNVDALRRRRSCNSIPLMPGMRTSSTRQPGFAAS
jgi:hypothetical protein